MQETNRSHAVAVPLALFATTIVLSAFLLFQVQPLIAKLILPWFGGSAAVWTSCMLFFQVALLGGYGYAHWLNQQSGKRQTAIHLSLLAVSLFSLPIIPSLRWKPVEPGDPLLGILGLLTVTVGLPYFLLSSTSPLLQTWYSRASGGALPYRLFALSNAGSMAGLLTYPVFIEPNLTNRVQAWTWSVGYGLFAVVCGTVAYLSRASAAEAKVAERNVEQAPSFLDKLLWMGLAAAASALLLAVTNHVTQNIAPIPFLWVAPLSLYLLSFILCFDSDRWYHRTTFCALAALALPGLAYAMVNGEAFGGIKPTIAFFCASIFVLFMICHGELARRRPAPVFLTSFYLMVSLGGATGGLLIGFAAPYLLNAVYDLPVIVVLTSVLMVYLLWKETAGGNVQIPAADPKDKVVAVFSVAAIIAFGLFRTVASIGFGAPRFLKGPYDAPVLYGLAGMVAAYLLWVSRVKGGTLRDARFARFAMAAGITAGMVTFLAKDMWTTNSGSLVLGRNFYGSLQVYDSDTDGDQGRVRVLRHGTIDHGEQFLRMTNRHRPTTYFTAKSGIGLAVHALQTQGPMHVGIIGLGAGTIAAYGRTEDNYRYYDINPLVLKVAEEQFSFLKDCRAKHDVVMGDARLVLERDPLERDPLKGYDLLVVDAFSGDAIPVHLLTREAWALYWRHLKPNGVLAVHVSNRYLHLAPVVDLGAVESGKTARMVSFDGGNIDEEAASDWVLVTSRPGFFDEGDLKTSALPIKSIPGLRAWTDDYSNVYKILR